MENKKLQPLSISRGFLKKIFWFLFQVSNIAEISMFLKGIQYFEWKADGNKVSGFQCSKEAI